MKSLIALIALFIMTSAHAGECTPNETLKIGQDLGQIQGKLKSYSRGPLAALTMNTGFIINEETKGFLFCDFYRKSVNAIRNYTRSVDKLIQEIEAFAQKNGTSELIQKLSDELEENKTRSVGAIYFSDFEDNYPDLAATRSSCGSMSREKMKKIIAQFRSAQSTLSEVKFFQYSGTMSNILLEIAENKINNCQ